MNKIHFQNATQLFQWTASHFFEQAKKILKHKPFFDVALSGGSTAQHFFPYVQSGDQEILKKTRWFFSDERAVKLESEQSNAGLAMRLLLEPLGLKEQFFPMFQGDESAGKAASTYEKLLRTLLPLNQEGIPVFDVVYLGMGLDGHTASLFPNSALLENIDSDTALIRATKEEHLEYERITMMPRLILAAENICILTTGQAKTQLIEEILTAPYQPTLWPIQLILKKRSKALSLLSSTSA